MRLSLGLVLIGALVPASASAAPTAAQKLFRAKLLKDPAVGAEVKARLREGGFVDRRVKFDDLTGEGKSDAVVVVHSGSSAGRIALYIFSALHGDDLKPVYRKEGLKQASVRVSEPSSGARAAVSYRVPTAEPGDEPCCPSTTRETTLRWSSGLERFVVAGRRTIEHTRAQYCSPSGDYCTSARKERGVVYLELRTFSFSGEYRLCVSDPAGGTTCREFELEKKPRSVQASRIRWSEHFPRLGAGIYRVCWQKFGTSCLGPKLTFRRG